MPLTTGMTPIFEIELYRDGFLVRYPDRHKPGEIGEFKETIRLLSTFDEYEELYRLLGVATVYKFNKKVREGGLNELILLSEALHEKKISILADKISRTKGCKLILIAGPSSSGKTTFAKKLAVDLRLNGIKTTTISVDNYFVERENTPKDEEGNYDVNIPLDINNHDLIWHLLSLVSEHFITYYIVLGICYLFENNSFINSILIAFFKDS